MTPVKTIPDATCRLQFNSQFTFRHATALIPYLHRLGISHCYASPYLKARPGSTHGYDIVDHNALNPEIGSEADYEHFVAELHRHGMGLILDTVPRRVYRISIRAMKPGNSCWSTLIIAILLISTETVDYWPALMMQWRAIGHSC